MTATAVTMPDFCSRRNPFHYATALNVLMQLGVDIHRIDLMAEGEYENYRGEIHRQKPKPGTPLTAETRIALHVGYPSAVDMMPYQFFYGFEGISNRGHGWDAEARALLAPFDGSVIRYHSLCRGELLKFVGGVAEMAHIRRFLGLLGFSLPPEADLREALLWAAFMPTFNFWAGNPVLVPKVLELLFGYSCRIVENAPAVHAIPDSLQSRLGGAEGRLGRSLVLGRTFRDCDSAYEIHFSGVPAEDVRELRPGRPKRRKLEWVLGVCMPSNLLYRMRFHVEHGEMRLGHKNSFLGYAAHL